MTPPDDEVDVYDSLGEAGVEDDLPPNAYELFRSKNKIEIESQKPLKKLIKEITRTWSSENTVSTAASTAATPFSNWHCYAVDDEEQPTLSIPTPKRQRPNNVPTSFLVAGKIGNKASNVFLRALFDSGSNACLIHKSALPEGVKLEELGASQKLLTIAGQYTSLHRVPLEDIHLPEFDRHRKIEGLHAYVFDSPCRYKIILGNDFLTATGIDIKFSDETVEWFGNTIPLRNPNDFAPEDSHVCLHTALMDMDDNFLSEHFDDEDIFEAYVSKILDAKYEEMSIEEVVQLQTHLTNEQQKQLADVMNRYPKVFGNDLGHYPHKKFHIDLEPGAKPVHRRAYPVPRMHEETFKKELDHLVEIGVLCRNRLRRGLELFCR